MSTQIFLGGAGCKPEYTKIAAHSFAFQPSLLPSVDKLFLGGTYIGGNQLDPGQALWSTTNYTATEPYVAGNIIGNIKVNGSGIGIPIPINLITDDIVKLTGTVGFPFANTLIELGYNVTLTIGAYYFSCEGSAIPDGTGAFTFIPVSTYTIDSSGVVCFSEEVTLGSNYDFHDTRLLLGYEISAFCPTGECLEFAAGNYATVSYTLDVERPCPKGPVTNYIIRNCCEPIIEELVNAPGLIVGKFYVDDEFNSWEVLSVSSDVTNFTRNFTNQFDSCAECKAYVLEQEGYECPSNLKIESCCVPGAEFVTGSLPGLNIGDTFVDNNGLCWTVSDSTSAPITEETITVGSIITGDCATCTDETNYPCPDFWYVRSCCAQLQEVIATNTALNIEDAFVDTNGMCWVVMDVATELPTNYNIIVDTVYTGAVPPLGNCDLCVAANPCPTEYFITIRACCDPDRYEVAQVPANFMFFSEGTVFSDYWGTCWEVMSYDTTGVETYPIYDWLAPKKPVVRTYKDCKDCQLQIGCSMIFQVKNCVTDVVSTVILNRVVLIGGFFFDKDTNSCYEVIGYGTLPFVGPFTYLTPSYQFDDCIECTLAIIGNKVVEFTPCCGGPNIIVTLTNGWYSGIGGVGTIIYPNNSEICVTMVGFSTGTPTLTVTRNNQFKTCLDCLNNFPCP